MGRSRNVGSAAWNIVGAMCRLLFARGSELSSRVARAEVGEPVTLSANISTSFEVIGRSQNAAAWKMSDGGTKMWKCLVVWKPEGWNDGIAWVEALAGDCADGEHGGVAGTGGGQTKHRTGLPALVTWVDTEQYAQIYPAVAPEVEGAMLHIAQAMVPWARLVNR